MPQNKIKRDVRNIPSLAGYVFYTFIKDGDEVSSGHLLPSELEGFMTDNGYTLKPESEEEV